MTQKSTNKQRRIQKVRSRPPKGKTLEAIWSWHGYFLEQYSKFIVEHDTDKLYNLREEIIKFNHMLETSWLSYRLTRLKVTNQQKLFDIYHELQSLDLSIAQRLIAFERDRRLLKHLNEVAFPEVDRFPVERDFSGWIQGETGYPDTLLSFLMASESGESNGQHLP